MQVNKCVRSEIKAGGIQGNLTKKGASESVFEELGVFYMMCSEEGDADKEMNRCKVPGAVWGVQELEETQV